MTHRSFSIVGARFHPPAGELLHHLPDDAEMVLVREPGNGHDANAVMVCLMIGYVPRNEAASLAPTLDTAHQPFIKGKLKTRGFGPMVDIPAAQLELFANDRPKD